MSHEMSPNGAVPQEQAPQEESVYYIRLNPDPAIQGLLRAKMEEYRQRSDQAVAQGGVNMDAVYKFLAVEALLTQGILDVSLMFDQLDIIKKSDSIKKNFWNAVDVVGIYNKGEMNRLKNV